MSPKTSLDLCPANVDLEKEPLNPVTPEEDSAINSQSKGALNEDHLELRVGQEEASRPSGRAARVLTRGFKSIAIFLIAFLAANGFWAIFRPEIYGHNGLFALNGKGEHMHPGHHHHHHHPHHHHKPDHPPPHGPHGGGPEHPPHPPPHGPPGHDHPHPPPPPPPHKPGHGPGGDRPGPPPGPPGHPHPPPPPPHKGPGKVHECFDLVPGETLEIQTPLEWVGQGVEVAPSLAGSSVTFVWDGEVGPPAPPRHGPPHPPHPPRPPHKKEESDEDSTNEDGEETISEKPEQKLGDVVFEIDVPSKAEFKAANISSDELKICSMSVPGSTGIHIFNATGIPPNHSHVNPAFEQVASSFKTTIRLPSHYARAPIRTGHP